MNLLVLMCLMLQGGGTPAIVERARVRPGSDVSFHALVLPETVFVGQAVTYELGVFISDEMRQRLRRNPEFVPPDLRSVLAYELHDTHTSQIVTREGRTYEVHVFRRALFPLAPGRVDIPPARLSYAVPLSSSFFSKEETKLLTSEPVHFVAIPAPAAGRPAKWSGAVGDMRISASVSANRARVGDPFVLTLRVSGSGNVSLWPRPELAVAWGTVVPGGERVRIDSLASSVRGAKEFDWLVTPSQEGAVTLPSVPYPYFDPAARQYRVASSASQSLRVNAGGLVGVDSVLPVATVIGALSLRASWSRPWPDSPVRALWYWLVFVAIPIPVLVRLWRARPKRQTPDAPDAVLRALAREAMPDIARVRAALRAALDARLGKTQVPWADPVLLPRALRHYGITDQTIRAAMDVLTRIETAAYGGANEPLPNIAGAACDLYDDIDREALAAGTGTHVIRRAGAAAIVLLAVSLAVSLAAQSPLSARAYFERGMTTYAAGSAAPAASDFLRAAQAVPGATAAWANAGTAGWMAGDTALAVVGWQRALRLDPLDDVSRDRLSLIGADAGAGRESVWPIPRRMPAWMALALWLAAWIALWRGEHRRIALAAVVVAIALAGTALVQQTRLTDARVAVVAQPAPLRLLPALGAEAGATPLTGELVRVLQRDGLWVRVAASGGREGWIDGGRLLTLDARPLRD